LREKYHWEDPGVDGRIIIKMDLREEGWEGMDRIDLAEDKNRWWAIVHAEMNFRVS
jgi:hypothetical protein